MFLRALNLYNLHIVISPLYLGIVTCLQTAFLFIFKRDLLHIETYDRVDMIFLSIVGIAAVSGQITMMLANRYAMASKMAPISYLENVFTLMADIWIFQYHFVITDIAGMLVIVACLAIPITLRTMGKNV